MAFRFRSQPAGLTAEDLLYQQVMGTRFVYDEFGTVVEAWQLEHRLVVEAQQIQRENYFDGKYYPQAILRALFPTVPSTRALPASRRNHALAAEVCGALGRSGRRRSDRPRAPGAGEKEGESGRRIRGGRHGRHRLAQRPTARAVDERRAPSAEAALEEEEKRAEKRAKAELAAAAPAPARPARGRARVGRAARRARGRDARPPPAGEGAAEGGPGRPGRRCRCAINFQTPWHPALTGRFAHRRRRSRVRPRGAQKRAADAAPIEASRADARAAAAARRASPGGPRRGSRRTASRAGRARRQNRRRRPRPRVPGGGVDVRCAGRAVRAHAPGDARAVAVAAGRRAPTSHGSGAVMRVPLSPTDEVDAILGDDATSTKDKILAINGLPLRRPSKMAGIVAAAARDQARARACAHACDALAYSLDDVADAVPALAAAVGLGVEDGGAS